MIDKEKNVFSKNKGLAAKMLIFSASTLLSSVFIGPRQDSSADSEAIESAEREVFTSRSAHEIWTELLDSSTSLKGTLIGVDGTEGIGDLVGGVTFGAEKEASSSLITRVMGPNGSSFKDGVKLLSDENRKEFLSDFFSNWIKDSNGYRTYRGENGERVDLATSVVDLAGEERPFDLSAFQNIDYSSAELEVLDEKFEKWIAQAGDSPFTYIAPNIRRKMFNGQLPGMSKEHFSNKIITASGGSSWSAPRYKNWTAILGKAEKYVDAAHGHNGGNNGGWEINFKPVASFGEFQSFISWFRTSLENRGQLFQAPGHQRMVFKKHPDLNTAKLAEVYKILQALIVVEGINGKTGIELANFKDVMPDSSLATLSTGRGVIRLEGNRFGEGTMAVEFRAGTKDPRVSQFVQMALAARVASNDFSGINNSDSWTLIGNEYQVNYRQLFKDTFGVSRSQAAKAADRIAVSGLPKSYLVPFWGWYDENCPFIGPVKRELLRDLTKNFIEQIADLPEHHEQARAGIRKLMNGWTRGSFIANDLRKYLMPQREFSASDNLHQFTRPEGRSYVNNVDVNQVDLGIEYSGKMPLKMQGDFTDPLVNDKRGWLVTRIDLSQDERVNLIKEIANDLGENLGGGRTAVQENSDGHGHGLDIAFSVRDSQNRKWKVEWDGISRTYNADGDIVDGSARSGSIELITPKFVPNMDEISAVYDAFSKNNILPYVKAGGGHINVDLAAFEGNPKALARFTSLFLEHRGIISLMFQHINRLKAGEPIDISPVLAQKLKNFNGTDDELKELLYNERYFNTREGRKTRYNQLDLTAYFQDVIPEAYITDDFDIVSPTEPWRRQFRVEPHIRKAEFRLFNAPKDAVESALQIKLVRGLLSKALNEADDLTGNVQKVDYESYLSNTESAYEDLEKLCNQLGLDVSEFKIAVAEGLSETQLAVSSINYEPLASKLAAYPKNSGWGQAVAPRSSEQAIGSEGRVWSPEAPEQVAVNNGGIINQIDVQAAEQADQLRSQMSSTVDGTRLRRDSGSCSGIFSRFFN